LKRISKLDGIRGLAIAAVLVFHLSLLLSSGANESSIVRSILRFTYIGRLGVDIFFVLSGFLITGIILKERSQPDFWSNFYLRRAFRILPVFAVVFVVTLLSARFFFPEMKISTSYVLSATFFLANWTFIGNNQMPMLPHLWSLAIEEQFYFLWPQAAKRLSNTAVFKFALILAVGCELLRIALAVAHANLSVVFLMTPTHIDGLAIGAALAAAMTMSETRQLLSRQWRRIALIAAIALLISVVGVRGTLFPLVWIQVFTIPPAVILTAMTIYGALESVLPASLSLFFETPVMTYLGRRSYALYLIHEPIRAAVSESFQDGKLAHLPPGIRTNILLIFAVLAISLILTEISWRLIELPMQNLRYRLMRGKVAGSLAIQSEEIAINQIVRQDQSSRASR
jgi:peptidoglycan/LPS O-acetylase OafA/YrhL